MSMPACAVCTSNESEPLYRGLERCRECGFVWADYELTGDDLQSIYSHDYFVGAEYPNYLNERPILELNFRTVLKELKRWKPNGRLLEVGSAYGFFLNLAKANYDVIGVDISAEACAFARTLGLEVYAGDFLDVVFPEASFDVVVCLATLEHLQRPDLYIQKISQLLKPGGIFYCTTIDRESWLARVMGSRWRMIHPPTHVSYFSRRTLQILAQRYQLTPLYCIAGCVSQFVPGHQSDEDHSNSSTLQPWRRSVTSCS